MREQKGELAQQPFFFNGCARRRRRAPRPYKPTHFPRKTRASKLNSTHAAFKLVRKMATVKLVRQSHFFVQQ